MELKTINKVEVNKIKLIHESGLELTTITDSKCIIPLEVDTILTIQKNIFNEYKPKPFIWDFIKNVIKKDKDMFKEYIIDYKYNDEYYGYIVYKDDSLLELRISDAYLILPESIKMFINIDLIPQKERNLKFELEEAIIKEDFEKASKIQKEIDEQSKTN